MKKEYVKPEIVFESFKLSTNIAGACVHKGNAADVNTCDFDTGVGVIFVNPVACSEKDGEFCVPDGSYMGYCYDVPNADSRVFAS